MSDLFTTLKLSSEFNNSVSSLKIGSIYNKNLEIRNLNLQRNIGKYPMYDTPMFPEIGMVYNVYERWLNRPVRHYSTYNSTLARTTGDTINGLIEWNNDIYENLNGSKHFATHTDSEGIDKLVYTTNSGNLGISGGERTLENVKSNIDEWFKEKKKYPYLADNNFEENQSGMGVNKGIADISYSINGDDKRNLQRWAHKLVSEKEYGSDVINTYNERDNSSNDVPNSYKNQTFDGVFIDVDDYTTLDRTLFSKTNELFKNGKINSLINRFQTKDGISRGRALLKEDGVPGLGGYDNPWCRVWTLSHQYHSMKDLIRPRMNDNQDEFLTIAEIQSGYKKEMRPNNGAKRLTDKSVLYSNGFVNITPFYNEDGELDTDSIKRCMFSIENLAWKDEIPTEMNPLVDDQWIAENNTKRTWFYSNGKPRLSKEQQGPNGGRIMWFPPYDLKFTENINTSWNSNTFIGRGENVYTYTNTERGGTLSFTMLIDHPSVINDWRGPSIETAGEKGKKNENDILRFFAGCGDLDNGSEQKPSETTEQTNKDNIVSNDPKPSTDTVALKFFVFFPNDYSGVDGTSDDFVQYICEGTYVKDGEVYASNSGYETSVSAHAIKNPYAGGTKELYNWYNLVDDDRIEDNLSYYLGKDGRYYYLENDIPTDKNPKKYSSNKDKSPYRLNTLKTEDGINGLYDILGLSGDFKKGNNLVSFADIVDALYQTYNSGLGTSENVEMLKTIVKNRWKIKNIGLNGLETSHGNTKGLANRRCETIQKFLMNTILQPDSSVFHIATSQVTMPNQDISSLTAKLSRSVEVTLEFESPESTTASSMRGTGNTNGEVREYFNWSDNNTGESFYDQEYKYFKQITAEDSFTRNKIIERIKYFDPAFHSITPEGFNGRLNFLQQCTRQGPSHAETKNLAFGRAPYCILKIGDFYNTKIIIDSISVNYGENQWDLNPEGVGVQPLMAKIDVNFKFIGGSDLSGPIDRLQNAISFNYYANASVYDGRAMINED